ncbi:MAG: DUF86 domain-containing protein [Ignavibacteria bacterium]|nr:DUF86 domain-containing protein [Ignavibacteria bacterium]
MIKNNFTYLNHILTSIKLIEEYSQGKKYDDLAANNMMQDAIIRQIEIIGEATSRISVVFKSEHPDLPWVDMKDMTNKLIHNYFGVNIKHVWNVVEQDIQPLKLQIEKILTDNNIQINLGFKNND